MQEFVVRVYVRGTVRTCQCCGTIHEGDKCPVCGWIEDESKRIWDMVNEMESTCFVCGGSVDECDCGGEGNV